MPANPARGEGAAARALGECAQGGPRAALSEDAVRTLCGRCVRTCAQSLTRHPAPAGEDSLCSVHLCLLVLNLRLNSEMSPGFPSCWRPKPSLALACGSPGGDSGLLLRARCSLWPLPAQRPLHAAHFEPGPGPAPEQNSHKAAVCGGRGVPNIVLSSRPGSSPGCSAHSGGRFSQLGLACPPQRILQRPASTPRDTQTVSGQRRVPRASASATSHWVWGRPPRGPSAG